MSDGTRGVNRWKRVRIALVAGSLTMLVTTAADWPTFLANPQRTAAGSGETTLSTSNASQLTKLWSYKTGGIVESSPAVVAGTVYVGSWDGYEYALNATTGGLLWKTYLGITSDPNCSPPSAGVSSAATVTGGVVYVGGGDSYWYALDASTGNVLWRVFTGDNSAASGHYNWSSPLLYNGYAYIGVASMGDCPLVQGQLLQVSLSTHQIVNTFTVVPNGQVGGGIWTSPSVDPVTNTIYATTGTITSYATEPYAQAIVALDASTLSVKDSWQLPANQQVTDSDWGNSPTLFSDSQNHPLVAAINKNGFAYAWNRTNLAAGPVWQTRVAVGGLCPTCGDGSVSSGAFANGLLFLGAGNTSLANGAGYPGVVRALNPGTGAFVWEHGAPGPVVPALAYANGLVIDGAGAWLEVLNAADGTLLYSYKAGAPLYAAPSVSNGEIFTGGVDGNVYAFGLPSSPSTPPPDPNCPSGFTCQDIGAPSPAGSETASGTTWAVTAGGTGVGGTSDSFRYIATPSTGDTQVAAEVNSIQSPSSASQTGLMVRQTADPNSPYYAGFAVSGGGVVVQYRSAFGGGTTTLNNVASSSPPIFLEIQRAGNQFQAATSMDGVNYTLVPGTSVTLPLPTTALAGVAVSSHVSGSSATATLTGAASGTPTNTPSSPVPATPCPSTWSCSDVGNPLLVGNQSLSSGAWTVSAAGSGIAGYADQFHFIWQSITADVTVGARVAAQTNTGSSAAAGVMLRQSTSAGSPYYAALLTPGNGIVVQYRASSGLRTTSAAALTGSAPAYLKVARSGNTFTAYTSPDGVTWTAVAGSSIALDITSSVLAGLAVSSANVPTMGGATIDTVAVTATAPPPPNACPSGWSCGDIGNPTPTGSQSLDATTGIWSIQGGGGDIWMNSDAFHYVWQPLPGSGTVSAHVTSQTNTSAWAKAGVMLRATSDPGSPYYAVFITPGNGITVQVRSTQGGSTVKVVNPPGTVPAFLEVADTGSTVTAYTSADGSAWTAIAGSAVTLNLGSALLAGLAVTSHNTGALSTVTMDTVSVETTIPPPPPPPPCPVGWTCADIGNPALAGSQSISGGAWTVQGGGTDIFGTADQFHYIYQSLAGSGSISAHADSQTNTSAWAKAGVMLRQTSDPGSPFYDAVVTPGNGIVVQYRATQGGGSSQKAAIGGVAPAYLLVADAAGTFTAYTSNDGATWTAIPGSSVTLNIAAPLLAGVAVTSHNSGALSTVTVDTVALGGSTPPPPPPPPTPTPTPTATPTPTPTPTPSPSCPSAWSCADIGNPSPAGGQSLAAGVWTIQAGGADIYGSADQFHYVWQILAANGSVSAHITSQTNTGPWAKAGVMLRSTTDPGSPYFAAFITPGNGITVQYRRTQGGTTAKVATATGTVPTYLEVSRSGGTFSAYVSADGVTWTLIAGSTVILNITGNMLEGLAVTSHHAGALCTVTMDTVVTS
jgi:outer membrane protein assembly factor BamB